VWMALGLAKHWQILIYQTFWVWSGNLIVVTGKLIVWRQSIAVVFSLAKLPGFKVQHLTIFISHKIFRSCVCTVRLELCNGFDFW
jgi:hypothetical protein